MLLKAENIIKNLMIHLYWTDILRGKRGEVVVIIGPQAQANLQSYAV